MEDEKRAHSVEWDAPSKEAGGAEDTVWEALIELEPCKAGAGPKNPGAVTMSVSSWRK